MDLLCETEIPYDKNKKIVWKIKMTPEEKAAADEAWRKKQEQKDLEWFETQEEKIERKKREAEAQIQAKKINM